MGLRLLAQNGCGMSDVLKNLSEEKRWKQEQEIMAPLRAAQEKYLTAHASLLDKTDPNALVNALGPLRGAQAGLAAAGAAKDTAQTQLLNQPNWMDWLISGINQRMGTNIPTQHSSVNSLPLAPILGGQPNTGSGSAAGNLSTPSGINYQIVQ